MINNDYFRELGLCQIYITDNIELKNDYVLSKYEKNNIPTLFVGIQNDQDKITMQNHKSNICVLLCDYDAEYIIQNNMSDFLLSDKIEKIFVTANFTKLDNLKHKYTVCNIEIKHRNQKIILINSPCFHYICNTLCDVLRQNNWQVDIITHDDIKKYAHLDCYFMLFTVYNIDLSILKKYIIYQFEQFINSKFSVHFNKFTIEQLKSIYNNASVVFDYNLININVTQNILNYKPSLLPTPIKYVHYDECNKINDIIFAGNMSPRRTHICNYVKMKYKLILPDKFLTGIDLQNFFRKSKILLNIHFYENAILERPRLNEALSCGIRIISEKPIDDDVYEDYKDIVDFINPISENMNELEKCIERVLKETNDVEFCKNHNIKVVNVVKKLEYEFNDKIKTIFNKKFIRENVDFELKYIPNTINESTFFKNVTNTKSTYTIPASNFKFDANFISNLIQECDNPYVYYHKTGITNCTLCHPCQILLWYPEANIYTKNKKITVKYENENYTLIDFHQKYFINQTLNYFLDSNEKNMIKNLNINYCNEIILLHCGNIDIGIEIINNIIQKELNKYTIAISYCTENIDKVIELVKSKFVNYFIIKTPNFGNDITPSFILYHNLKKILKFNYIMKLHTKSDKIWRNEMIEPLINNCDYIFKKMETDNNINLCCAKKWLLKFDIFCCEYTKTIIDDYNNKSQKEINKNAKTFCGGTCFISRTKIFEKLIYENSDKFIKTLLFFPFYVLNLTFHENSPAHTYERLFGYLIDKNEYNVGV